MCVERCRRTHTRQGIHLASRKMVRGSIDGTNFTSALVFECKTGRCIGAIAAATKRACRLVLTGNAFALDACDAKQVGFQIHHITANVAYFGAANQAKGITALARVFKFNGHLSVCKHTCRLLITYSCAIGGSDAVPRTVPWRGGA